MTRKEAKEITKEYALSYLDFGMDLTDTTLPSPIDNIYNDFENRVCENCIYTKSIDADIEVSDKCIIHIIPCSSIGGCDCFKQKDNT